jgi:phospholipid/cholesterol/gamma-HCH transport system substrate-binding protein
MSNRPRRLVAVVCALLLVLSGCVGNDELELDAVFDDVIDLVPRHQVRAGDVRIGTVTSIELTDDDRALVRMRVRRDTGLPAEVEAVLRQTAVLGERFVELRPISEGGELSAGRVAQTRVLSDIEHLVGTGGDLVAAVSADRLATAIEVGAVAFGGRGGALGNVLDHLQILIGTYDSRQDDVIRLIDAADTLVSGLAVEAEVNAEAIAELARAAAALEEEDERLLDAIDDLRRLAIVGDRILHTHRDEFDDALRRLRLTLEQVLRINQALENMLTWLPAHNLHVPNGILHEMSQVWNDFSVCGVHDEPDNPSNSCTPPNPGQPNDPPPTYAGPDECDFRHENCPYDEDDGDPYQPYGRSSR